MYRRSGYVILFVRMCTAITHTFFMLKKAGATAIKLPLSTMYDTFSLYRFCVLLILIEVRCFYLFQIKAFQPILE